ncbi:MAG: A24 family peptidase [Pseudomonadota bacterium]
MTPPVFSILGCIVLLVAFPLTRQLAGLLLSQADLAWSTSSRDWAKASAAPADLQARLEDLRPPDHAVLDAPVSWILRGIWAVATAGALWATEDPVAAGLLILASVTLLTAAQVDLRAKILPDVCVLLFAACGILVCLIGHGPTPGDALIGSLAGFVTFLTLQVGFRVLRGREMLGLGDVKLFAAAGLWVGWQGLALVGLIASLLGILQFTLTKRGSQSAIAFGPSLALATLISLGVLAA